MKMFQVLPFKSEQEAIDYKKRHRIRKCVIAYSEFDGEWLLARTIRL